MERSRPLNPGALPYGTVVGPWRVLEQRGRGSYGVVYRAERVGEEHAAPVALKIALYPRDRRFEREVELLSRLLHYHVPRLLGEGRWKGPGGVAFPYLVMEWVEGLSLYEWAAEVRPPWYKVMRVLAQVARALAATHAAKGVHRDVKGSNVLVRAKDGTAVLLDFGSGDYQGSSMVTRSPEPPGTPLYWSPECLRFQWESGRDRKARYKARPADDVYALGMMAWRLVTGDYPTPAPGPDDVEQLDGSWFSEPVLLPPQALSDAPPELAALILRMLSSNPSERGSARGVARALEREARKARRAARQARTQRREMTPALRPAWTDALGLAREGWSGFLLLAVSALVVVCLCGVELSPNAELPEEVAEEARDRGKADGGTSSLADTTVTERTSAEDIELGRDAVALEMPKTPLPGQRHPPCPRPETEINGGCWKRLADEVPPCADNSYVWKTSCYTPANVPSRPRTSEPP